MNITEVFSDVMLDECGVGSSRIDCHCGRTHFTYKLHDQSDEEFNDLMTRMSEKPDNYVYENSDDSISARDFNGDVFVLGCPCGWEKKYSAFLWAEKNIIVKFLKKCRDIKLKEAIEIDKLMEDS